MQANGRGTSGRFATGNPGGPGRPRREVEREYLDALTATVSLADWRKIVARAVAQAKAGSDKARSWLAGYLMGKRPPDDEPRDRKELIFRIVEDEGWFGNDAHSKAAGATGDNPDPGDDQ